MTSRNSPEAAPSGALWKRYFFHLLEHFPCAAYVKDASGRYLLAHQSLGSPLLFDIHRWLGRTDAEIGLFGTRETAEMEAQDRRVLQSRARSERLEMLVLGRAERFFRTIKFPLIDEQERLCVAGISLDITDQVIMESRLRRSEEKLKQAESVAHLGHYEIDIRTGLATWSDETFRLFGMDPHVDSEPDVDAYRNLVVEEDRDRLFAQFARCAAKGCPFDLEYRIARRDGRVRHVHSVGRVTRNSGGTVETLFGTLQDVTELKRTEQALRNSENRARNLATHLRRIREDERTRIAREIHDNVTQALVALRIELGRATGLRPAADERPRGDSPAAAPFITARLAPLIDLVDDTITRAQALGADLRPSLLDDLGLAAALRSHLETTAKRCGLSYRLHVDPPNPVLDHNTETALFRIFQEALSNVVRHAEADEVTVSVRRTRHGVDLAVSDDGRGIADANLANPGAYGIMGMRERAEALAGTLEVSRCGKRGTTVSARLPVS